MCRTLEIPHENRHEPLRGAGMEPRPFLDKK